MATMVVTALGSEVRVFKWDMQLPQEESAAAASSLSGSASSTSTLEFLGGVFLIRLRTTLPRDSETGIYRDYDIFFPKSSLKELEYTHAAKKLIGGALKQLPNLGSCKNLEAVARSLADDLLLRFKFGSEILSGNDAVPVIYLRLEVQLKKSRKKVNDREQMFLDFVHELVYGRDDFRSHQLRRLCRELCYGGSKSADVQEPPLGLEEVKPVMEIKYYEDGMSGDTVCSICFETFTEGTMFVEKSCPYRFHKKCMHEWFFDNLPDSTCPICKSICIVIV